MNRCPNCRAEYGPLIAVYVDRDQFDTDELDTPMPPPRWTICGGCLDAIDQMLAARAGAVR